jgi:four helix bundle protein
LNLGQSHLLSAIRPAAFGLRVHRPDGRKEMLMKLQVHEMAITIIEALAPLAPLVARHDRDLASQLRRAASSMALNIAESEYSDPGNRRARLFTAAGSTNESRSALRVAVAWGYIPVGRATEVLAQLDQVMAILWRLTHGP